MIKHSFCDVCHGEITILNPFYFLDENSEPTEEIEGHQVECGSCEIFWDEYTDNKVRV